MDVYALEITHSLYLSMYLPKQADLTESSVWTILSSMQLKI